MTAAAMKSTWNTKQKPQILWPTFLTNLAICVLLLAYILLGSFIFLIIEREESTLLPHHQERQQNLRISANGTSSFASSTQFFNSTSAFNISSSILDGISLLYDRVNMDVGSGGDDEMAVSDPSTQNMLVLNTYDMRQRTIEKIWEITVSLNILYKENWTELANQEISKFQDQLINTISKDTLPKMSYKLAGTSDSYMSDRTRSNIPAMEAVLLHTHHPCKHLQERKEWNFAKAFLYALTVLTTIGYGSMTPCTTLGRLVTIIYALFGIPLALVYLSSTGGILAKIAREVFSKALCCCLCSNCGYCCYDEKRMAEKERRTRRKRQLDELQKQQSIIQEPYFVHTDFIGDRSFEKQQRFAVAGDNMTSMPETDSLSVSESHGSMHGLIILAPILLCFSMVIFYIILGAFILKQLENWPMLDGIYFCFMSLSTIGFGDILTGERIEPITTTWFCSIYIMSGMPLTAMCFNVMHEEIVHRIKIFIEFKNKSAVRDIAPNEEGYFFPP